MESIFDKILVYLLIAFGIWLISAVILFPTVIAFFSYRWLKEKGYKYVGIVLLIVAPVWTAYEVYTAIYPTDSFYFSEFKRVALREPPNTAVIIRKVASYPDIHGDYCSASLITMSDNDYLQLLNEITSNPEITKTEEVIRNDELYEVLGDIKVDQIANRFTKESPEKRGRYLFIGFLSDKRTIVVCVCQT